MVTCCYVDKSNSRDSWKGINDVRKQLCSWHQLLAESCHMALIIFLLEKERWGKISDYSLVI